MKHKNYHAHRESCAGKIGHDTAAQAGMQKRKLQKKTWWQINVYKCRYCGKYHVGRAPMRFAGAVWGKR